MSDHPTVFGFGLSAHRDDDYPMEFLSHHIIGTNPDREDGAWATKEEALQNFASQFSALAQFAKHNFLFVRRPPELVSVASFEDTSRHYKMIGRFSMAKIKENG